MSEDPTQAWVKATMGLRLMGSVPKVVAAGDGLVAALAKSNTFIELLKGMVEQLEDEKHEGFGYDLEDLQRRLVP